MHTETVGKQGRVSKLIACFSLWRLWHASPEALVSEGEQDTLIFCKRHTESWVDSNTCINIVSGWSGRTQIDLCNTQQVNAMLWLSRCDMGCRQCVCLGRRQILLPTSRLFSSTSRRLLVSKGFLFMQVVRILKLNPNLPWIEAYASVMLIFKAAIHYVPYASAWTSSKCVVWHAFTFFPFFFSGEKAIRVRGQQRKFLGAKME